MWANLEDHAEPHSFGGHSGQHFVLPWAEARICHRQVLIAASLLVGKSSIESIGTGRPQELVRLAKQRLCDGHRALTLWPAKWRAASLTKEISQAEDRDSSLPTRQELLCRHDEAIRYPPFCLTKSTPHCSRVN